MYRFLSRCHVIPRTTTDQTPAEMRMMRLPRFILDLVYPALDNRVLDKQTTAWEHKVLRCHCVNSTRMMRFGRCTSLVSQNGCPECFRPNWVLSFIVELIDGRVWRRHIDHVSEFPRRVMVMLEWRHQCRQVFVHL